MKKNVIKGFVLLLCASVAVISCTNEENSVQTNSQERNIVLKSNDGISEFSVFLNDTYGKNYSVDSEAITVTEDDETYKIYKVTLSGNKEGYIFETPTYGNYFYEHDADAKVVTESYYSTKGLENEIVDVSGDPYYQHHGFNPILVHDDPVVAPSKFWGWKITNYGGCGPNSEGKYFAGVLVTHYIAGIGGKEKQLMNGNSPITVPCDPGPPPTHDDYNGPLKF